MINMIPANFVPSVGSPDPSLGSTMTRAKTMFMTVPSLQQMAQSDNVDIARAAMDELAQRGIQVSRSAASPQSHSPSPQGSMPGAASEPSPLARVAGGAMMGAPWNTGYDSGEPAMLPPGAAAAQPAPAAPPSAPSPIQAPGVPGTQAAPKSPAMQAIQAGVDTAEEAADPMGDMSPVLQAALASADASEPDAADPSGSVIQQLMNGSSASPWLALAKAGFAMAGSRSPTFFGALGEGANAGLDEFQRQQQQDVMNRVRAVGLQQDANRLQETKRSNKVQEGQGQAKVEIANQNLELAKQELAEKTRQFNVGQATEQDVKAAQVNLMNAQAVAASANAAESGARADYYQRGDLMQDGAGNLIRVQGDKSTTIKGEDGKPVQATKPVARSSTINDKAAILRGAGYTEQQIAAAIAGGKMTQTQMMNAASNYAKNATAGLIGPEQEAKFQEKYREAMDSFGAPADAAPAASGASQNGGGVTYQPGQTIIIKGKKYTVGDDGKTAIPQ